MHQNSLEDLLKQSAGLHHQNFLLCGSRSALEFAFLISTQAMLMMLVQEPHFQKHFSHIIESLFPSLTWSPTRCPPVTRIQPHGFVQAYFSSESSCHTHRHAWLLSSDWRTNITSSNSHLLTTVFNFFLLY